MHHVTGLVLAGGRSSRMGTNKALLEINGETLLNRTMQLLERVGCRQVLISGDYDGYRCVRDQEKLGPLSGIAAGLAACQTEQLLILPVDMPYMTCEILQRLLHGQNNGNGVSYVDAQFPLLLRNNAANHGILAGLLASDTPAHQRSMSAFYRSAQITELAIDPNLRHCFNNTNTPEEWQQCQLLLNGIK